MFNKIDYFKYLRGEFVWKNDRKWDRVDILLALSHSRSTFFSKVLTMQENSSVRVEKSAVARRFLILRRRRRRGPAAWLLLPSLSYSRVRETDLVTCQPLVRNNPARSVRARPPSSEVPSSLGAPQPHCTSFGAC